MDEKIVEHFYVMNSNELIVASYLKGNRYLYGITSEETIDKDILLDTLVSMFNKGMVVSDGNKMCLTDKFDFIIGRINNAKQVIYVEKCNNQLPQLVYYYDKENGVITVRMHGIEKNIKLSVMDKDSFMRYLFDNKYLPIAFESEDIYTGNCDEKFVERLLKFERRDSRTGILLETIYIDKTVTYYRIICDRNNETEIFDYTTENLRKILWEELYDLG